MSKIEPKDKSILSSEEVYKVLSEHLGWFSIEAIIGEWNEDGFGDILEPDSHEVTIHFYETQESIDDSLCEVVYPIGTLLGYLKDWLLSQGCSFGTFASPKDGWRATLILGKETKVFEGKDEVGALCDAVVFFNLFVRAQQ